MKKNKQTKELKSLSGVHSAKKSKLNHTNSSRSNKSSKPPFHIGNVSPSYSKSTISTNSVNSSKKIIRKKKIIKSEEEIEEFPLHLPNPSNPNFFRKSDPKKSLDNTFEERWNQYIELRTLDKSRKQIYFGVYFNKWKRCFTNSYINRVKKQTKQLESFRFENYTKSHIDILEDNIDTAELIRLAKTKVQEMESDTFMRSSPSKMNRTCKRPVQTIEDRTEINDTQLSPMKTFQKSFNIIDIPPLPTSNNFSISSPIKKYQIVTNLDVLNTSIQLQHKAEEILQESSISISSDHGDKIEHLTEDSLTASSDLSDEKPIPRKSNYFTSRINQLNTSLADSFNAAPPKFNNQAKKPKDKVNYSINFESSIINESSQISDIESSPRKLEPSINKEQSIQRIKKHEPLSEKIETIDQYEEDTSSDIQFTIGNSFSD